MKKIKFTCPGCDAKLRVPTHLAGVSAPCPKCGATITAPTDLDHVVDEAPQKVSPPGRSVPAVRQEASPKRGREVTGSVLAAAGNPDTTGPKVTGEEAAARTPTAPAPENAPVSPEPLPEPSQDPEAPPPPVPSAPSGLPSPVSARPDVHRHASAAEPEVIVTEEKIISPQPVPLTQPTVTDHPPIPEDSPVENENTQVPVPKTQPIRLNPRPDSLLPPRNDETAGPELPRLDVNLAEPVSEQASTTSPGIPESAPMRVQLPQVGAAGEELSPEDFFSPEQSAPPHSPPAADLQTGTSAEPPENRDGFPGPGDQTPSASPTEQALDGSDNLDPDPGQPGLEEWNRQYLPTDDPDRGTHMDEIESTEEPAAPEQGNVIRDEVPPVAVPEAPPEEFPFDDQVPGAEAAAEAPSLPPEDFSESQHPLEQGSFENLLSQRIEPETTAEYPEQSHPDQGQVVSLDFPFPSSEAEAAPLPPTRPEQMPARTDADVLDEMFGSSGGARKMKKSTMVMISVIVAVVIIASISAYLIGKALGGFNPTIAERAQGQVPPPPFSSIEDESSESAVARPASAGEEPGIDDAPAVIDPVARERVPANQAGTPPIASPGNSGESSRPEPPAAPEQIPLPPASGPSGPDADGSTTALTDPAPPGGTGIGSDDSNLTFDERLAETLNRTGNGTSNPSVGTSPSENAGSGTGTDNPALPAATGAAAAPAAAGNNADPEARNYNPRAAFAAPDGSETSPLGKTHDLLDAFLRAPNWQAQIPYIYQGESLRPVIEDYYKRFPFTTFDRFSLSLFQLEDDPEMGGPYWVYLVSRSDTEQGYPVIVRVEDGNLKVDWEIYSEFQDRHFASFLEGSIASPGTFRVVIERVSDYYGPDRSDFTDLGDYLVYQINPPYGDLGEFSEYAFVKKDSEVAKRLEEVVGLGEEALAVIVTLEQKKFAHGVTHEVITDYVTEGWFR